MKIHRVKLYRLQNEEWFQHGLDLKSLLTIRQGHRAAAKQKKAEEEAAV